MWSRKTAEKQAHEERGPRGVPNGNILSRSMHTKEREGFRMNKNRRRRRGGGVQKENMVRIMNRKEKEGIQIENWYIRKFSPEQ